MSATGLRAFDSTIQRANIWLDDIMDELDWNDRERAYRALAAVPHALRDRLPLTKSAQLAAQLPQMIRGLYFEGWATLPTLHFVSGRIWWAMPGWVPSAPSSRERHWNQFLDHVSASLDPEAITRAVLKTLTKHVSPGEIVDVKHCLPGKIRKHWR